MGAAKKLKELFFGSSTPGNSSAKEAKKVKVVSQTAEEISEINNNPHGNSRHDKQEIEILKHKISRRFKDDPGAAKKAAAIIERMLNTPSKK